MTPGRNTYRGLELPARHRGKSGNDAVRRLPLATWPGRISSLDPRPGSFHRVSLSFQHGKTFAPSDFLRRKL